MDRLTAPHAMFPFLCNGSNTDHISIGETELLGRKFYNLGATTEKAISLMAIHLFLLGYNIYSKAPEEGNKKPEVGMGMGAGSVPMARVTKYLLGSTNEVFLCFLPHGGK